MLVKVWNEQGVMALCESGQLEEMKKGGFKFDKPQAAKEVEEVVEEKKEEAVEEVPEKKTTTRRGRKAKDVEEKEEEEKAEGPDIVL